MLFRSTFRYLDSRFAARPAILAANKAAFQAGWNYGETTEAFSVQYEVAPATIAPGTYRNITGNTALALGLVTASATWELPQELLQRQARKTLARRVMEMRESGVGEEEIKARERMLQRDVLSSTAQALKEHFVLQKIAEAEKLEIDQSDIDRKSTRLNSSHRSLSRMPSSA